MFGKRKSINILIWLTNFLGKLVSILSMKWGKKLTYQVTRIAEIFLVNKVIVRADIMEAVESAVSTSDPTWWSSKWLGGRSSS